MALVENSLEYKGEGGFGIRDSKSVTLKVGNALLMFKSDNHTSRDYSQDVEPRWKKSIGEEVQRLSFDVINNIAEKESQQRGLRRNMETGHFEKSSYDKLKEGNGLTNQVVVGQGSVDQQNEGLRPTLSLERDFYEEEVHAIIMECDGNKASRPDGYTMSFFKNQWAMVKRALMVFIANFQQTGEGETEKTPMEFSLGWVGGKEETSLERKMKICGGKSFKKRMNEIPWSYYLVISSSNYVSCDLDPLISRNHKFSKTTIVLQLRYDFWSSSSRSGEVVNIKGVAFSLSFPMVSESSHLKFCRESYGRNTKTYAVEISIASHIIDNKSKKTKKEVEWSELRPGQLNFNVDGAARGNLREFGIGGVLKDDQGRILVTFSKSIGVRNANRVELLALKEAFFIFMASKWAFSHYLLIESDSLITVKWSNCPSVTPWRLRKHIL
ncbi:Uncharacterized protein TCM_007835 [Theobroma cacao]|uniref:RNase H type-1 domain-containing protein n=1 Tax=Theobroma cacao TaxID=3641 RepID=A0A061E2S1_THECC|nr:Uncharacterized protein TCM_007835 [Theobroma cacao]